MFERNALTELRQWGQDPVTSRWYSGEPGKLGKPRSWTSSLQNTMYV